QPFFVQLQTGFKIRTQVTITPGQCSTPAAGVIDGKAAEADDSAATADYLKARPGCRTSIDSNRNPLGLDSRLLGNLDLEHAIDVPCLDRLSSCRIRQGETAQERARDAFDVFEAVAANVFPRRPFATNRQRAVFGGDFDVLERDARQIRTQHEVVAFLLQIHRRRPSRAIGYSREWERCVRTPGE